MKNIVIGLIVLLAAVFIYQLIEGGPAENSASGGPESQSPEVAQKEQATSSLSTSAADDARVFIIEPVNGASVASPLKVVFGIENMDIAPAGQNLPNSGHHHLLIDLSELPALDAPLPASDNIIHFGKGQTETIIELEPGDHSLQLLLGNYLHIPHIQAVISDKILINVTE